MENLVVYGPANGYEGDRPVRFKGTPEQAAANKKTHRFIWSDGDDYCMNCAIKGWHTAAQYPCGEEPPREFWDGRI